MARAPENIEFSSTAYAYERLQLGFQLISIKPLIGKLSVRLIIVNKKPNTTFS